MVLERRYRTFYDTLKIEDRVTQYKFFNIGSRSKGLSVTNINYDGILDRDHSFELKEIVLVFKPRIYNTHFNPYWIGNFNQMIWNSVMEYRVCGRYSFHIWKSALLINTGVLSVDENLLIASKINMSDYNIVFEPNVAFTLILDMLDSTKYDYRILAGTEICMAISGFINNDI